MYLVGSKLNQQLLYKSSTYSSNEPSNQIIFQNIISEHGGTEADYSIYRINDATIFAKRIQNGDDFLLVWSDVAPNGIISSIDFAPEDSKLWLKFYTLNGISEILANNRDSATLIIEVWLADKSGIDTAFNSIIHLPVTTPSGEAQIICKFSNGVCTKLIKTNTFGNWVFPNNSKRISDYRVFNTQEIIVLLSF